MLVAHTYMTSRDSEWLLSPDAIKCCQELIAIIHQVAPDAPSQIPDTWLERADEIAQISLAADGEKPLGPVTIARMVWMDMHKDLWRFIDEQE